MSLLGSNLFPVIRCAILRLSIDLMRGGDERAERWCKFVSSTNDALQDRKVSGREDVSSHDDCS